MMVCDICKKEYGVIDKHHIVSKCNGGTNDFSNIAYICPNHHRLVHKGLVIIEGRFDTTSGSRIVWRDYRKPSITGFDDPEVYIIGENDEI